MTTHRPWAAVLLPVLLVLGLGVAPPAQAGKPKVTCDAEILLNTGRCVVVKSGEEEEPAEEGTVPKGPGRDPNAPYMERRLAAVCSGNTLDSPDAVCTAAITMCDSVPGAAENSIAFWVWTRLHYPGRAEEDQPAWNRQPGYQCLGGDEAPDAPTPAQAAALVQRDFADFVVLTGTTRIDPAGRALMNVPTIFSTNRTGPEVLPDLPPVLGFTISITVTPERYTWHFGDGSAPLTTTTPGQPKVKEVTHTYRQPGRVNPYVVIEWSGTFTVNGSEPLQVRGTATTTGAPTPLTVVSASSQLVAR